ncbi:MAG: diguanylate cyclase domain-containing protein [Anaerolineales bacterium]
MLELQIDMLIRALIEGTAPVLSLLTFVALLFMASVNVRVKNRRRILDGITSSTIVERDRACRAQGATDFLYAALRRSYYVVGLVSVGGLCTLPFIPMAPSSRAILWASLSGMAFVGPGIMYLSLRSRDHDGESDTRKRLTEAEVLAADPHILNMYDGVSGLYATRFWLRALELRVRRKLRLYAPITCLLLELPDLDTIRSHYGNSIADEVVSQFACHLRNNTRGDDLGARVGYNRFAVAAMRCPADKASIIGRRIVHNASSVTVIGDGAPLTFVLQIRWVSATSPAYSVNPSLLLHTSTTAMDRTSRWPSGVPSTRSYPPLQAAA